MNILDNMDTDTSDDEFDAKSIKSKKSVKRSDKKKDEKKKEKSEKKKEKTTISDKDNKDKVERRNILRDKSFITIGGRFRKWSMKSLNEIQCTQIFYCHWQELSMRGDKEKV